MTDIEDKIALKPIQKVEVSNVTSPVELTGDIMVDTFGALDDAKVTDPDAASATIPALLRGNLTKLNELKALIGTASDDENDVTVIGLLTRIALAVEV
jgi:hypothetical protein